VSGSLGRTAGILSYYVLCSEACRARGQRQGKSDVLEQGGRRKHQAGDGPEWRIFAPEMTHSCATMAHPATETTRPAAGFRRTNPRSPLTLNETGCEAGRTSRAERPNEPERRRNPGQSRKAPRNCAMPWIRAADGAGTAHAGPRHRRTNPRATQAAAFAGSMPGARPPARGPWVGLSAVFGPPRLPCHNPLRARELMCR
jgi:hypothetical protein